MGVVTGVIGCLQALETIKIILMSDVNSYFIPESNEALKVSSGMMVIFDALSGRFRNIKLRPRRTEANDVSFTHILYSITIPANYIMAFVTYALIEVLCIL